MELLCRAVVLRTVKPKLDAQAMEGQKLKNIRLTKTKRDDSKCLEI